jgi:hypothetical protein
MVTKFLSREKQYIKHKIIFTASGHSLTGNRFMYKISTTLLIKLLDPIVAMALAEKRGEPLSIL